jgi:hypothetical protein
MRENLELQNIKWGPYCIYVSSYTASSSPINVKLINFFNKQVVSDTRMCSIIILASNLNRVMEVL